GNAGGSVVDAETDRGAVGDAGDQHGDLGLHANGRFYALAGQLQLDAMRFGDCCPRDGGRPKESRIAGIEQRERLGDAAELLSVSLPFADDLKCGAGPRLGVLRGGDRQEDSVPEMVGWSWAGSAKTRARAPFPPRRQPLNRQFDIPFVAGEPLDLDERASRRARAPN